MTMNEYATRVAPYAYVRKRGTKEVFAYEERLMMRGDMVPYYGKLPVPKDFVVPQAEIDMMEALKQIKQGNLEPGMKVATAYLRKMGTKEIFLATPSLIQRADMVSYYGAVPVPENFIVPPDEIEMLIFLGKIKAPELKPEEQIAAPPLEREQLSDGVDTPPPDPTRHQTKIYKIIEAIGKMSPDDFSPRTGKPDARIIGTMIGELVVSEERDEAWDKIQLSTPTSETITDLAKEPSDEEEEKDEG